MKATSLFRILFVTLSLVMAPAAMLAQDPGEVKARMAQRQPAVDALKDSGVAGENNRGYLEARGNPSAEHEKIISDENADRRAAYAYIAAQTGSDINTVGRTRAQKIAINSKRGVWIQDPNGEWRQKT